MTTHAKDAARNRLCSATSCAVQCVALQAIAARVSVLHMAARMLIEPYLSRCFAEQRVLDLA